VIEKKQVEVAASVLKFVELSRVDIFEGIWVSVSLLHCPRSQLMNVLERSEKVLVLGCVAFTSRSRFPFNM